MTDTTIALYKLVSTRRPGERDSDREHDTEHTMYRNSVWVYGSLCVVSFLSLFALISYVLVTSSAVLQSQPLHIKMEAQSDEQSESRHREKRQGSCQVDMCLTKECVLAASSIINSMDTEVDPCHDFYEYACGQWIKDHQHMTGLESLFYGVNHNTMPEKIDITLNKLLKSMDWIADKSLLESKPYTDLVFFYKSCLDLNEEPDGDMSQVYELLKKMENFQVGRPFQAESWNLTKALLEMIRMNGAPLFDIIIDADIQNSNRYSIVVTAPRRYGLIPSLVGPSLRTRGRPDLQEFLRSKGRQALFGDMSDDMVLTEMLTGLDKGARRAAHSAASGDVHDSPRINIVPTQDLFGAKDVTGKDTDEKPTSITLPPSTPDTTLNTPTPTHNTPTSTHMPTITTHTSPITTHMSTTTHTHSTTTHTPSTTTHTPSTTTHTPSTTTHTPSTTTHTPITTTSPADSLDATAELEEYEEGEDDMFSIMAVSRKEVYQVFKDNQEMKRLEAISKVMLDLVTHSNTTQLFDVPLLDDYLPPDDHPANLTTEEILSIVTSTFLTALFQIHPDEREELKAEQHGDLYNHYTLPQLQQDFPAVEWGYLLRELFNKSITDEDNIYVYFPDYLKSLSSLLHDLPPWVVHYGLLTVYIYDVLLETVSISHDTDQNDFCLQATKSVFGDVMSNMYLHYIGNTTVTNIRTHAASMLELLREEVEVSIRSSEWMSKKDKVVALEKLNLLQAEVGAYDRHWNISYVNESHSEIRFLPNFTFLDAVVELYQVFRVDIYRLYHTPIDKGSFIWAFTVQPFIVNAFHMQSTNTIVFPEAFFQPPYYLTRGPEYMNYGSAATAMAHEIFHGMDFTGMLFDARGELTRPFSDKTRQKLNETADCYHNLLAHAFYEVVLVQYTMIAMDIDSSATLNENLADIAGIRHAYRAYQRWVERHYVEPRLPALPLSPEQLFFVSAAQPYCAVIPALAKIFLMELDEHLPNNMRINAVMMNTPEFAQVFNCSQDSRMVAHETCHIF